MPHRPLRSALCAATLLLGLLPAAAVAAQPGVSVVGNSGEPGLAAQALTGAPAGQKWVYMPVSWAQLQPDEGDQPTDPPQNGILADIEARVREYNASGINIMVVLTEAPDWAHPGSTGVNHPPSDRHFASYANFAAWMVTHFKNIGMSIAAWQVWNEPNDGVFWIGGPQPARYSGLLKAAYGAIKGADPSAIVVTGGLVHNDYNFLEDLYEHGAGGSFDAVGTHMSTACLTRDPGFYERNIETGRIDVYYFTAYREVHQQMAKHGQDKPIFMEIGWSVAKDQPCNVGSKTGNSGVSVDDQAKFLTQAYQCLATDPYVRAAAWFSLMDAHREYRSYDSRMGLTDFGGNPRASFHAMQAVSRGVTPAFCGGKVDTDKPAVQLDVPDLYFDRLHVRGSATDSTTPIRQIELWVNGKRVVGANQDGGRYDLDWFGSTKLDYGKHTIELHALDEAFNRGVATKVVTKMNPKNAKGTVLPRLTFNARKKGRRIRVTARVRRALDHPEDPRGRLRIFFERRTGRRWKPTSRYTKGISKPIRLTYTPKKRGRWRVWARLAVDAPYKVVRTRKYIFRAG